MAMVLTGGGHGPDRRSKFCCWACPLVGLIPTRPRCPAASAQLETPHCYLHRLCVANCIDPTVVASLIAQRAADGHRHQMALAILELGGPHPIHFTRSYLRATGAQTDDADKLLTDTYRRRTAVRYACTFCTAGRDVETFDHQRFCLCLRHGRWRAPATNPTNSGPYPTCPHGSAPSGTTGGRPQPDS